MTRFNFVLSSALVLAVVCATAVVPPPKPAMPMVKLTNGVLRNSTVHMPAVGFGTFGYGACNITTGACHGGQAWNNTMIVPLVKAFIEMGGRRIDGAFSYLTQKGMGIAIKDAIEKKVVTREELFVTSKTDIYNPPARFANDTGYEYHLWQFENILRNTQLEYIDLLLVHWPGDAHVDPKKTNMSCAEGHPLAGDHKGYSLCRKEAWKAFNHLLVTKKVRAIGVSNFEKRHLVDVTADTKPAVNQMEWHPFYHEDALAEHCADEDIHYQSYSPLGAYDHMTCKTQGCRDWKIAPLDHPVVAAVAERHGITAAQAILKWAWQSHGVSCNPRTRNPVHMRQNLEALSPPELAADDVVLISGIMGISPAPDTACANPYCDNKVCPEPKFIV